MGSRTGRCYLSLPIGPRRSCSPCTLRSSLPETCSDEESKNLPEWHQDLAFTAEENPNTTPLLSVEDFAHLADDELRFNLACTNTHTRCFYVGAQISLSIHTLCFKWSPPTQLLSQIIKFNHHKQSGPALAVMGGAIYINESNFRSRMLVEETSVILKLMRLNSLDGVTKLAGSPFYLPIIIIETEYRPHPLPLTIAGVATKLVSLSKPVDSNTSDARL